MNFTPDTKSGTDTNTHVASSARRNGRFANNGQAGTCARGVNLNTERKMKMTLREKVAEVEPEKISNGEAGGVCGCPSFYDYLNAEDYPGCISCEECWNQEWKYEPKLKITQIIHWMSTGRKLCARAIFNMTSGIK